MVLRPTAVLCRTAVVCCRTTESLGVGHWSGVNFVVVFQMLLLVFAGKDGRIELCDRQ